MYSIYFS